MTSLRKDLLAAFMTQAPFQPATNYWRAVEIEEVIKCGLPKGQGLDLGCGDGHLMAVILEKVGPRELVGLDIDAQETTLASDRKLYRQVLTAPADQLPFAEGQFDFIFSNSVLEHIENIDSVLKECARVLRPGGRFLFTVPGPDFHKCLKGPRFGGDRELYVRDVDARCFHLRYWSAKDWAEHLQSAGMIQVQAHEYLTQAETRRWEWLARNTSGMLYAMSGAKKQPIEIQRQMGMRNGWLRLPHFLAAVSASVMGYGVQSGNRSTCGCLLVEARKAAGQAL